jgi:phage tail sheath protein FI
MSVTTSYPGIYIQELPSSSHAIVPAPTSIAAFIGYSHPFRTGNFGNALQLFSFSDYETYFGGLFTSGLIDASLPRAVYQFFLNGGSTAYVVGLQPGLFGATSARFGLLSTDMRFTVSIHTSAGTGLLIAAQEPTDIVPMAVQVTNINAAKSSFDLIFTYGTRIETYRGVLLTDASIKALNAASGLVHITQMDGATWGTTLPSPGLTTFPTTPSNPPASYTTGYAGADFLPVFEANGSLDNVEIFNLLLIPGIGDNEVVSAALAFAERKRAFAILDPPPQAPASTGSSSPPAPIQAWMSGLGGAGGYVLPTSQNGALYFPYLVSTDPITSNNVPMAPSGFVAGIYAATDASRGVWKAPAGLATVVLNTSGPVLSGVMNDPQQGVLNLDSINCLRSFAGTGTVVWGARTLVASNTAYQQSMYVPVRRMTLFIEQTLLANLRWVVFEPNDDPLWTAIKSSIEAFLLSLFRQGGLQGSTPSEAFQVKCDSTTTTPTDQQNGIVNIVVAFAPLKPAEFVIVKIAQLAGQTAGA